MVRCCADGCDNPVDESERNLRMEKVAHGVDEPDRWLLPPARRIEAPGEQRYVEAIFIAHALEPLGERFCIAILAAWRDLRATGNRVPGVISPFDF